MAKNHSLKTRKAPQNHFIKITITITMTMKEYSLSEINFSFSQTNVVFKKGCIADLPNLILKLKDLDDDPRTALFIGGRSLEKSGHLKKIQKSLSEMGIESYIFSCGSEEAEVEHVNDGIKFCIEKNIKVIVGIGGGSVMDTAKAVAGIVTNGGKMEDYHNGKQFKEHGLPLILVPTTSGTGSEASNNAVILDKKRKIKQSIRGSQIQAIHALLDPELIITCPKKITAYSGGDAFVQAIEAYFSKYSHEISDMYALKAIQLIADNLPKAFNNGQDIEARSAVHLGSYLAGVAFSNVKLGAVHGFAHPIGVQFDVPHGLICSLMLPYVLEFNKPVREEKYRKLEEIMKNSHADYKGNNLNEMMFDFLDKLEIPKKLSEIGIQEKDFDNIVKDTKGGSLEANPRPTTPELLREILKSAL